MLAQDTRNEIKSNYPKISFAISTRITKKMAGLVNDGFTYTESAELAVLPYFSAESASGNADGVDSERSYISKLVQTYKPAIYTSKNIFTEEDLKKAF